MLPDHVVTLFQIFCLGVKKMPALGLETQFEPNIERVERPETEPRTPNPEQRVCCGLAEREK